MKRIINRKSAKHFSVFFVIAALVQVVVTLGNTSGLLSAQANLASSVAISLSIGESPVTSGMTINGTENLKAVITPWVVTLSNDSNINLSAVSFYLDTSSGAPAAGLSGTYIGSSMWTAGLSLYDSNTLPNGTYTFYAKALYGSVVNGSYEYTAESDHYIINISRGTSGSSVTDPTPTPAITPAITLNASIDSITSSSTSAAPASISGSNSVSVTSDYSFPSLSFYIYKYSPSETINYYSSNLLNMTLVSGSQGKNWTGTLYTGHLSDASYYFYAKGPYSETGTEYMSNYVYFNVNNGTVTPTPTPTPNYAIEAVTPTPTPTPTTPYITVEVTDTVSGATISGTKTVKAYSDVALSSLMVKFYNTTTQTYSSHYLTASKTDGTYKTWSATLDTTKLSNENYEIKAKGYYNSDYYYSNNFINVNISNSVATPTPTLVATPSPTPATTPYITVESGEIVPGSNVSGTKTIKAYSDIALSSLMFKFYNTSTKTYSSYYVTASKLDETYKNWFASFDTTKLSDGNYDIKAKGYYNNNYYYSNNAININISNSAATATPKPTYTPTPAPTVTKNFTITAKIEGAASGSTIDGTKNVYATSVGSDDLTLLDSLTFYFNATYSNTVYGVASGTSSDKKNWSASFATANLPNGNYDFFAKGWYGGNYYKSDIVNINIKNISETVASPTPKPTIEPVYIKFTDDSYTTVKGDKQISVVLNQEVDSLKFVISGAKYAEPAVLKDSPTSYRFVWKTNEFPNGYYTIKAVAKRSASEVFASIGMNVYNSVYDDIDTKPTIAEYGSASGVSSSSSSTVSAVPKECVEKGFLTPADCEKYFQVPQDCREQNILDPIKCEEYMFKLAMPEECRKQGAETQEQCSKIIFLSAMPESCRNAKVTTEEECNKILSAEVNVTLDCKNANITTPEACDKYMFDKYASASVIAKNDFPAECQKAGVKTSEECEKVMRKEYMPQNCKDQGISDPGQCDTYLKQKYMPKECRDKGAKTNGECNKILFEKFAPEECKKAGISDEKECKDFMFNLYASKAICNGLEDWQCKNLIKENHLGSIAAKQVDYGKIKEKVKPLAGDSIKSEDLKQKIGSENEIVPIKESGIKLKVMIAEEKLVLNKDNSLIQTAPVVLTIDADGDGLPDDLEKRVGTDLKNSDTDGDGFTDSEELKNGYNPLGSGKLPDDYKEKISPVDWAMIQNKTLSHPTTDGTESKDFTVSAIANIGSSKNGSSSKGYALNGKADPNSVVTLYLYSDLPLVATAKTDEYGNWKYEFDESLVDGEHEVYVTVNDNTGKVTSKSKPLSFFVNEAKAVSVQDFVSSQSAAAPKESEKAIQSYTIIAIAITIIGIIAFTFWILARRAKRAH